MRLMCFAEGLDAPNSHVQAGRAQEYGGLPVGAFIQPPARRLAPTVAHAIFFDQTHDQKSPVEVRHLLSSNCITTKSNLGEGIIKDVKCVF